MAVTRRTPPAEVREHRHRCIRSDKRNAVIAAIFSGVVLASTARDICEAYPTVRDPPRVLLGATLVVCLMVYWIARVRCRYERLWLSLASIGGVLALAKGYAPEAMSPFGRPAMVFSLVIWSAATLVSLGYARSAFQTAKTDPSRRGS